MNRALILPVIETFLLYGYDRPGWIPSHIVNNWDTNPYAYQTEEDMMPAGGLHGDILTYIKESLKYHLSLQGFMFLLDIFILYRDAQGIKQRFAPDLTLMPFRSKAPSSCDLDKEDVPKVLIEATSAASHKKDLKDNVAFYSSLGISTYLVIDAITPQNEFREKIRLYLWQIRGGKFCRVLPDKNGFFLLPEIQVCIKAQEHRLILKNALTDEIFRDNIQFSIDYKKITALAERERQRANKVTALAERERQRANKEQQRAEKERQRAEKLAAKLKSLGIDPDE